MGASAKGRGQRVLALGESGYGKTTLLLRLLADWSAVSDTPDAHVNDPDHIFLFYGSKIR